MFWLAEDDCGAAQSAASRSLQSGLDLYLRLRGLQLGAHAKSGGHSFGGVGRGRRVSAWAGFSPIGPRNIRNQLLATTRDEKQQAKHRIPQFFSSLLVSGWSVNSIVTIQSGFPFTPQLAYNPSNDGDTRNPVRAFLNPSFTGPVVLGNPKQWFDPNAFIAPPNNSGFFGNVGRDTYIGPGLATWDFSVLKETHITEGLNLQFRAEIFNLLNRANFNTPNLITNVLLPGTTTPVQSPAAGVIISTST